ncbi:GNAT family N-acetyltransferase [Alkalibacterium sp. MB6]|uniref:GNAT family N-acetyltransferase n=1 Tax=Alkalibacterium sp. MB6 TaxID=2081965 RepID=UPI0013795E2A|nr:GNAT family N-acetyltransferase [Alkalibacterium sp. MB6]
MTYSHLDIRQIKKKDFKHAMTFARQGMHHDWFVSNKVALALYSRYAFYDVLLCSSTVMGAYLDNRLVGFLFGEFRNESVVYTNIRYKLYCFLFEKMMQWLGYDGMANDYTQANKEMLDDFMTHTPYPDGELTFFAVDPAETGKGIGSLLLKEVSKKHQNKLVYLYTDSGSTYQFYLHRGFIQSGKRDIKFKNDNGETFPLTCYLFSKTL